MVTITPTGMTMVEVTSRSNVVSMVISPCLVIISVRTDIDLLFGDPVTVFGISRVPVSLITLLPVVI